MKSKLPLVPQILLFYLCASLGQAAWAANLAYIHGDISEQGFTPAASATSGSTLPYDQMLLGDTGRTGLSLFKQMVQGQGHTISQHYDQNTVLSAAFLSDKDLIIFGLHQKSWSSTEKSALRAWLNDGGGMLIYSDSASGGFYARVGAQNTVGQSATNNLISEYGMQVTVDQADGVTAHTANNNTSIFAIDGKTFEGEGVSPVAIESGSASVEVLIPYNRAVNKPQNITFDNPQYAALVLRSVGTGHIVVMFDRQPLWNNGPGSDIGKQDNQQILQGLVNFLGKRPTKTSWPTPLKNGRLIVGAITLLLSDENNPVIK